MKSKKVLLGLFVGLLACTTGTITAQTKANFQNDRLVEIGPNNIGGRVRAIIVDQRDTNNETLYAGGVAGGLYTKNINDPEWNYIPYFQANGTELTLPISNMVQLPDNTILIATGESKYQKGYNFSPLAPLGRGIFRFNPEDQTFQVISNTVPTTPADNFAAVNKIVCMPNGNAVIVYVATPTGLYRWNIASEADWNTAPAVIYNGVVDDIELNQPRNLAFFTSGNKLFKIGNVTGNSNPVNISGTNPAFAAPNTRIELALAPTNSSYLYAMVLADNYMENVYLTKDQQNWTKLATSTVSPFVYSDANICGSLTVDPQNEDKIYVGGDAIWIGQGYVEGSYYQWTKSSYSEYDLNMGDYMASVFSNPMFVHSGIHNIATATKDGLTQYYIATDGGVFSTEYMSVFTNINRGMNISQINGLAVCPDGSIIAGAHSNGCPFIEARMDHYGGDIDSSWYDQGSTTNHIANILWTGNGGQVAASMFQQYAPMNRRYIFTSSNNGKLGRSYADYNDYTNTQTWSSMEEFTSSLNTGGNPVTQVALWETNTNTVINDTLVFKIDTNATCHGYRNDSLGDWRMSVGFTVKANDTIITYSQKNVYYPVTYVADHDFVVEEGTTCKIVNPLQSRMFAVVKSNLNKKSTIMMNWYPTDASKVWRDADQENFDVIMNWSRVYMVDNTDSSIIHAIAVSNDGNALFATVDDPIHETSTLVRVSGFNTAVDYSQSLWSIRQQMNCDLNDYRLTIDTLRVFNRMITALTTNVRPNTDGVIITFGGFDATEANVLYMDNASAAEPTFTDKSVAGKAIPVYSAMVEITTGEVYVGTENGVYVTSEQTFNGTPSWTTYGAFDGVPVTAMYQQTRELPIARYTMHTGTNVENYVFAKTKYPYAMYFGTYGRGIFMDSTYVTDHENEIVDSTDYNQGINEVAFNNGCVKVYPNPATSIANIDINIPVAGSAIVKVYDLSGKVVFNDNLGSLSAGNYSHAINCQNLSKGMYIVNVIVGNQSAATKLIVR